MKRILFSMLALIFLLFTLSACSSPVFSDIPPRLSYSSSSLYQDAGNIREAVGAHPDYSLFKFKS